MGFGLVTEIILNSYRSVTTSNYNCFISSHTLQFTLPRCSHTWELAPASEHRADFTQFLNRDGR
jgi:hypothetical protein